ncbi:MAG: hypothetical protein IJA90_08160 [Peptococcaceae bacterium]|nr:hypothetical protein [Peptococcaceae bacterium]
MKKREVLSSEETKALSLKLENAEVAYKQAKELYYEINNNVYSLECDVEETQEEIDSLQTQIEELERKSQELMEKSEKQKILLESQRFELALQEQRQKQLEEDRDRLEEAYEQAKKDYEKSFTKDFLNQVFLLSNKNSMQVNLYADTKTTQIMTDFEKSKKEFLYLYLGEPRFLVERDNKKYSVKCGLIVTRNCGDVIREGLQPTMTNIKKWEDDGRLQPLTNAIIWALEEQETVIEGGVYPLGQPHQIGGQTKRNQTGYGSIYHRGVLCSQGTLYGEVTDFLVVGVKVESIYETW